MIILKYKTIDLSGLTTQCLFAMRVAESVLERMGHDLMITSVNDGKHMRGSIHYTGNAFDFSLIGDDTKPACDEIKRALGPHFDVVIEGNHVHIEYQPKYKNS